MVGAIRPRGPVTTKARVIERLAAHAACWDRENGGEEFPAERLAALGEAGALGCFAMLEGPDDVDALLRALRLVGGADLSLGRIFEGHVNAAQIVRAYGTAAQVAALERDLSAGRSLGVWNTDAQPDGVEIVTAEGGYRLTGAKKFATGAGHIDGALITARREDGAKQLVLVPMAGEEARADNSAWRVRGMRGSASGTFDFTGMVVATDALIGAPGDYEREPRFSAGAWRFAAVQLGAVEALLRHWRDHLLATGKATDPIQRARIGQSIVAGRSAGLWVARAARLAETERPEAIAHVLMTRGVVEEAALAAMDGAARAVGTASFFEESRIDRITRDLSLYLRQPVPDQARDRAAAAWLEQDRWGDDPWW